MISRRWIYGAGTVIIAASLMLWRKSHSAAPASPVAATPAASRSTVALPPPGAAISGGAGNVPKALERQGHAIPDSLRSHLQRALASGDPLVWEPALRELASLKYDREGEIAELLPLLNYPDWDVRVRASHLLLELGSTAGHDVLNAALGAAARGEKVPWAAVVTAASTLQQYRQSIDGDALWAVYQRLRAPELLEIATMQQLPQVRDLVLEKRRNRELGYDTEYLAAYLGMMDAESISNYQRLMTAYPRAELLGHWALYRSTGEAQHLEFVISTARQAVGLEQTAESSPVMADVKYLAFDFLEITLAERAKETLREIADYSAQRASSGSADFGRAFGALFYLHKDYAFVDERVLAFLRGSYAGPGVDRGLMMQIAAVRSTPEIEAAAKAFNPAAYEYAFVQMQGRPVESWWPNLRRVPVSVAPPLK